MRGIVIGILLLVWECWGGWDAPFRLMEDCAVDGEATFVDGQSGKAHVVFRAKNKYGAYGHYLGVTPDGNREPPFNFSKQTVWQEGPAFSITGEHNGRDLYIVMVVNRGAYRDLQFVESTSDGEYWSKPIVPRGIVENDTSNRDMPSLLYSQSERLMLFYRKDSYLYYVTRPPDTTVWSIERRIDTGDCLNLLSTSALFSAMVPSAVPPRVVFHFICKTVRSRWVPLMGESKDNGNTWQLFPSSKFDMTGNISSVLAPQAVQTRLYGVLTQDEEGWRRTTLYEYTIGGTWKDISTGPSSKAARPRSLKTCVLEGALSLLYYDTIVLKRYSIAEPWKETAFPLPGLASKTADNQVDCGAEHLIATGYKDAILHAQWYSFDSSL
jgi:hypothetical protein